MATFYSNFSLEPRGKNIVSICLGTACHVRGGERVREKIEGTLDICDGETSQDMSFSLESVRCIGCCSLGPVIKVNDDIHARISSEDVENILNNYE
jgi:NADH:ubiquinone oxidoreductase subunit E